MKNYINRKITINLLLAIALSSNTTQIKPMLGKIMPRTLYGISASLTGILSYLFAHKIQQIRVKNIGKACLESSIESLNKAKKSGQDEKFNQNISDTLKAISTIQAPLLKMSFFEKQEIINCMKRNENQNVKYFNFCTTFASKYRK